ncbi:unnamed protein product [Rotaria sordida]|uniref:Lipocalin/cytosolic fatty-acid binding domain-containing protein n=2 Tax=Rotaria sordida TaxID=392033 RepID=A0A814G6R0_9BILA|nr:unnamed protein product [Rotaria sordida]
MGWQCRPPVFSSLPVQRNFDLCRYLGTWYEIKWYRNRPVTDVWGDYAQLWDFKDHSERYLKVDGQARRPNETNCFSFGPWSVDASLNATQIHDELTAAYVQGVVSYSAIAHWIDRFLSGRESLEDNPRNGRPITVITKQNIDAVQDLVNDDPHISIGYVTTISDRVII